MNLLEVPFRALGQIGPRLIMIAAMVTSYTTQNHLFLSWGVDALTAAVAPAVIDVLAITCAEILHDQYVVRGKLWAGLVLAVAGGASGYANWLAGETMGSRAVHAGMVAAYVMAELVVGAVKRRAADTATTAIAPVATPAATPEPVAVPVVAVPDTVAELEQEAEGSDAPVSPAPAGEPEEPEMAPGKPRGPYGPRKGEDYSRRHKSRLASGK